MASMGVPFDPGHGAVPKGSSQFSEETEDALVLRAKSDRQAFGELYDRYYTKILNYAYRHTLNVAVAEEVTSNTFFKAFQALANYDHRNRFSAWLYRIATNEINGHCRWKRSRRENDPQWQEDLCRIRFSSQPLSVYEVVEQREEKMLTFAKLHNALNRLPEHYQTAIVLRYFEAMSFEEVAEVLGRKVGTVKSSDFTGIETFKNKL